MVPPVLLIDDNHDDLFILKRLLTRAGIKNAIVTFDHALEAKRFLEAAIRTPDTGLIPAAIFSEKNMDGVDGFELLKWARQQEVLRKIPFYLITSSIEPRDTERAKKLGATRFIEKFPPHHFFAELLR